MIPIAYLVSFLGQSAGLPESQLSSNSTQTLSVEVSYKMVSESYSDVRLIFRKRVKGKVRDCKSFPVGGSYGAPRVLAFGNYTNKNRKQVFISTEAGAVVSYLLDYDGTKVSILYKKDSGRVHTFPGWDSKGRFVVQEEDWNEDYDRSGRHIGRHWTCHSVTIKNALGAGDQSL